MVEKEAVGDQNPLWKTWWKGKVSLCLPPGKYSFQRPNGSFRKRWNSKKVPAFLRDSLPIVCSGHQAVGEFLIGERERGEKKSNSQILVSIEVCQTTSKIGFDCVASQCI